MDKQNHGGHQNLKSLKIKRLESITREEFEESYRNAKPFVLTGMTSHTHSIETPGIANQWEALSKWTPEHLQQIGELHPVCESHCSVVDLLEELHQVFLADDNLHFLAKGQVKTKSMTFNQVVDQIYQPQDTEDAQRIYLRAPLYPELKEDIGFPTFLLGTSNSREEAETSFQDNISGLWIGSNGNITPLHFDLWHGFLIQISGLKSIVLFSPDDNTFLYQHDSLSPNAHTCMIDLCLPMSEILNKYPLFEEATPYSAILAPGELLYIPPCWFHDVVSLENAISVTLRWNLRTFESVHPCAIK